MAALAGAVLDKQARQLAKLHKTDIDQSALVTEMTPRGCIPACRRH